MFILYKWCTGQSSRTKQNLTILFHPRNVSYWTFHKRIIFYSHLYWKDEKNAVNPIESRDVFACVNLYFAFQTLAESSLRMETSSFFLPDQLNLVNFTHPELFPYLNCISLPHKIPAG